METSGNVASDLGIGFARSVKDVEKATLRLPCECSEFPVEVKVDIFDVHYYGRAIPRGLIVREDEIWIVALRIDGYWHLEITIKDVLGYQRGSKFVKWRNYLRRIVRWPWNDGDTKEIMKKKTKDG